MSKLTAVAYYGGIPRSNNNPEKPLILDNFLEGVRRSGDNAIDHRGMNAIPCDVALIQGFVHEHGKSAPHLQLRRNAVDLQKKNGKRSLIVDSNLFLYADPGNSRRYLRYSFDGVFPTTGFYFDKDIIPGRWDKVSRELGITLKDWKEDGSHILICLQRNGGWSMRGLHVMEWLDNTVKEIRKYSDRHIIVRPHPGDKKARQYLRVRYPNASISRNPNIVDDLKNAWATVVYNSSPAVASLIEGVPVFLTDPDPRHSQAWPIAENEMEKLEMPGHRPREDWIRKLCMCHWNFDELKSGEAWQFFRQYV